MEYVEANFQIRCSGNTITISGALEKTVYAEICDFLTEAEKQIEHDTVILDLRPLKFINSTGIRTLAVHLTGSTKKFKILFDDAVIWQKPTLLAIQQVKPSTIHLYENCSPAEASENAAGAVAL